MKLKEIADRISAHLKRFESDARGNAPRPTGGMTLSPYYNANAVDSGRYVLVTYTSYSGSTAISKADALRYLEWLDAGNEGRHFEAFRAA